MISYILRLTMIQINRNILNESVSSGVPKSKLDLKLMGFQCQKEESECYSLGNESIKIVIKAGEWWV